MPKSYTYVPYRDTGYFSNLVTDYLGGHDQIKPFYVNAPDEEGLKKAIGERASYPVDRNLLADTLKQKYTLLNTIPEADANIASLLSPNTFTVCTAHQPNLLTGYLYFVYKILHAIKLAEHLNLQYPDKHFVPVFYMGSEDNDLEELGTFRFRDKKYVWDGMGQQGAVGRMNTLGLKTLLQELFRSFGPPGKHCDALQALLTEAYLKHNSIATATQYLVHELFGRYGLLVLNPDDAGLKGTFTKIMQSELEEGASHAIVTSQIEKLSAHYNAQAHPRPINLFYLADGLRERIEKRGDVWCVVNSTKEWTLAELREELQQNPERFSPNVILRGLYQETILPNVAFIGGGAEVAYWLQLRTLFEHHHVFFPCIFLRQSVQWVSEAAARLRQQLALSIADVFKPEDQLVNTYIEQHSTGEWKTESEKQAINGIFKMLQDKATRLDPTLNAAAAAALKKMEYQLDILEKKMLRAEKRKMQTGLDRIGRLKALLFPGQKLQERTENFMEYYLEYGPGYFDVIKEGIKPVEGAFLVIE